MIVTFKDEIIDFLKNHENQEFTPNELAKWFVENHPEEAEQKANASKNNKMLEATTLEEKRKVIIEIYAGEISSSKLSAVRRKEPNIQVIFKPKIKFYYTQNLNAQVNNQPSINYKTKINKEDKITEEQAGILLSSYLKTKLKVHNMYIDHNFSSNKHGTNGNAWLHPDWVGFEILNEKWGSIIKECAKYYSGQQARLWSFEVKRYIDRSNIRQCFFQALSNSSWAHYGYLVAPDLLESKQNDTRHELEMLCARHGIGFILLNKTEPDKSEILIPAKEKPEIDWNIANRIAEENKDFAEYINNIDTFHKKQSLINTKWFDASKILQPKTKKKK